MQSLLAWSLQPEGRGEYTICIIFSTLVSIVLIVGVDWAGTYFVSSQNQNRHVFINASLSLYFIQTIICIPLMIALIQLPIEFFSKAPKTALYVSIPYAIGNMGVLQLSAIVRGLRDFTFSAGLSVFKDALLLTTIYLLYKFSLISLSLIIICTTIGYFFYILCVIWRLYSKWEFRLSLPSGTAIKQLLTYGSKIYVGSIGMMVNVRIGTILISFLMDTGDIGIFAIATAIMGQLITPADVITGITMPRVSASADGRTTLIQACCSCLSLFVLISGTVLALTNAYWIPFLFSSSFLPSGYLLWILLPGFWLRSISKILTAYFNGTNRPQYVSYSTAINLVTNILLLWWLLPRFGLAGGAWAASLSFMISSIFLIAMYSSKTANSPTKLFIPSLDAIKEYWYLVIKKKK